MVKLKNALLVPMVIGLVAYGGVKGYLYFKVKQGLDRIVALAAPVATLKYGAIETSLTGAISVADIKATPIGAATGMTIDQAELKGRGVAFLLDVAGGFNMNQPPEQLHLSVSRMRIPMGSDYLDAFGLKVAGQPHAMCSLGGLLAQTGVEQLGFQQLVADASLRYDYSQRAGEINFVMDYAMAGLSNFGMEMSISGVPQPGTLVSGAIPQIKQMIVRYQVDQGYTQRVIESCAKQAGQDRSSFVSALFNQEPGYFVKNIGFVPGEGIRFTLRHLLTQPGELRITLSPEGAIDPGILSAYKPQDLLRVLGVNASINGQPVSDLSFTLPEGGEKLASLFGDGVALGPEKGVQGQAKGSSAVKLVRTRYIATPVGELQRYIGRDVRVFAADRDEPQQGVLVAMKNGQLDLEQRLHGGKMTLYIQASKIERVEVLRRVAAALAE
ncbi:hypothetical protein [Sedimenticola selenatireducens]|uniref:DUF945 domain-containing protein n=1 Tax=Sedimenticola selenatireducens TaxID=191960 RepID=A0A557SH39_9GAMM|nr:hypothetical protein [Sedimenticola selenatireducens]TVO76739.1 hypothetical protein FHP88_04765 [Sedimenticola selenatireducens]TVT64182.1 MAG: hypothetical protein FHK78_08010 [Sedimenticola selenatireducens]